MKKGLLHFLLDILFVFAGFFMLIYYKDLYYFIMACLGWSLIFKFVEWLVEGE